MQVRAVTVGASAAFDDGVLVLPEQLGPFLAQAHTYFERAGLPVQGMRLACQPLAAVTGLTRENTVEYAQALARVAGILGFDYVSLGPVDAAHLDWIPLLIEALVNVETAFGSVIVAERGGTVSLEAIAAAVTVIRTLAERTPDGFGNVRFAALANCPAGIPFFPAGYHEPNTPPRFAVAWEAADLAVDAFSQASTLSDAEARLFERVTTEGQRVVAAAEALTRATGVPFAGIDISLAPFPSDDRSIAAAFERLGVDWFGAPGTLFVAALITRVLKRVPLPKTGFCGLMLPVLEDSVLAKRAIEGRYGLSDLLVWSAVCGLGFDVVPLPGDITTAELRGLVLDMATLAVTLDKPLTARLMPLPGKHAGERAVFSFAYFAPAGILAARGGGAQGLFAREGISWQG